MVEQVWMNIVLLALKSFQIIEITRPLSSNPKDFTIHNLYKLDISGYLAITLVSLRSRRVMIDLFVCIGFHY